MKDLVSMSNCAWINNVIIPEVSDTHGAIVSESARRLRIQQPSIWPFFLSSGEIFEFLYLCRTMVMIRHLFYIVAIVIKSLGGPKFDSDHPGSCRGQT